MDAMGDVRRDVRQCVQAFLASGGVEAENPEVAALIREELFRAAIREELAQARESYGWRMKMRDVVHNGCLLNGD
jgi:hypothetical protein